MAIRRAALLILGFAGSVIMATILYISAESGLIQPALETIPTEALLDNLLSKQTEIELPYPVPGTTLIAERLSAYDGPFLEDGTDREVVNVAALQVKNVGTKSVRNAAIFLSGSNIGFAFFGEHIPPGGTVVLLEKNAAKFQKGSIFTCTGSQMISSDNEVLHKVTITDISMGTLVVTNTSNTPLRNLSFCYKSWLSSQNMYVGGISYTIELPQLMPGQTAYLYPKHYATGYSKVVSVTADE